MWRRSVKGCCALFFLFLFFLIIIYGCRSLPWLFNCGIDIGWFSFPVHQQSDKGFERICEDQIWKTKKKNHLYEINAPIIKSYNHPDGPRVASVSLPTLSRIILHFLGDLIPPSVGSGAFLCYSSCSCNSVTEVCLQLVMGCHQLQRRDLFFFLMCQWWGSVYLGRITVSIIRGVIVCRSELTHNHQHPSRSWSASRREKRLKHVRLCTSV